MDCDIHYAKTNLSKLIKQVESGEEVFLVRRGERVARLVPAGKAKPKFGTLRGKVGAIADDQLFAMPDEDADSFIDGNWK